MKIKKFLLLCFITAPAFNAYSINKVTFESLSEKDKDTFTRGLYDYRPHPAYKANVESIPETVKVIDLFGHMEVDDRFMETLCKSDRFKKLVSIDLRGTSVTTKTLDLLSSSKNVGVLRYLPEMSESYGQARTKIYVYTDLQIGPEDYKKPTSDFILSYEDMYGEKTAEDRIGIKFLEVFSTANSK